MWSHICCVANLLHFQASEEEALFVQQHQRWLPHSGVAAQAVATLAQTAVFAGHWRGEQEMPDQAFRWEVQDARFLTFFFWAISILLRVFAIAYIGWAHRRRSARTTLIAERAMVWISIFTCTFNPLTNLWRGPKLLGEDPREAWYGNQEVEGAEVMSVAVVLMHLTVMSSLSLRCSTLWVHHILSAVPNVLIRSFHSPFPLTNKLMHIMVATVAVASFTCAYRIESMTRQNWMAMRISQNAAKGSQQELEKQQATTDAMRSVLNVTFDAVLQTGDTFAITGEKNSRFRSVLGEVHSSASSGLRLHDFFSAAERDRLEKLARAASTHHVPQLMATAITSPDGEHTRQVEVLIADTKLDGEHKYLLGLKVPPLPLDNQVDSLPTDCHDEARQNQGQGRDAANRRQRRGRGDAETIPQEPAPSAVRQTEADQSSIPSAESNASTTWAPLQIRGGRNKPNALCATIDTTSPNFDIISCSAMFADVCQPYARGHEFATWIHEPDDFHRLFQNQVNAVATNDDDDPGDVPGMHVTLRPPAALAEGIEFRVCIKVDPQSIRVVGGASERKVLAKIALHRVRWRPIQDEDSAVREIVL